MPAGQQLRHSVNVDHGWTVGKSSPGHLSKEEPDSSQGVRLGGLVVASASLTDPSLHLSQDVLCGTSAPPCYSLICKAGCHGNWWFCTGQSREGRQWTETQKHITWLFKKSVGDCGGGNKGFTATCLGKNNNRTPTSSRWKRNWSIFTVVFSC